MKRTERGHMGQEARDVNQKERGRINFVVEIKPRCGGIRMQGETAKLGALRES